MSYKDGDDLKVYMHVGTKPVTWPEFAAATLTEVTVVEDCRLNPTKTKKQRKNRGKAWVINSMGKKDATVELTLSNDPTDTALRKLLDDGWYGDEPLVMAFLDGDKDTDGSMGLYGVFGVFDVSENGPADDVSSLTFSLAPLAGERTPEQVTASAPTTTTTTVA